MKRILMAVLTLSLIAGLSVSSFAANEEKQAERAAMQEQKQLLQENREALRAQNQENKALGQEYKVLKTQSKTDGGLTESQKEALAAVKQAVAEQRAILDETKGEAKTLTLAAKEQKKTGDIAAATESWEQAAALTGERLAAKEEISALLAEKKAVLTEAEA